ncbi:MAG: hypothetical protein AB7N91_22650 [Candidatus Tectimicrobiota bacterium]
MREPQPALVLLICQAVLLALGLGHWLGLPPGQRQGRLLDVWRVERAATPPPATLLAQGEWLMAHRLRSLQALGTLSAVSAGIGLGEGWARRRRDPYGGVGFLHFALGQFLLVGTLGGLISYVLLPWPLPPSTSAVLLAGLAGTTLFCLAAGKPLIR